MTALVFLDTETTGLSYDDDIWEFAAIRREPDGTETERHLFLSHSPRKCRRLPERFLADHDRRFPGSCSDQRHPDVVPKYEAAGQISDFLKGRPHIVGAVPNFDTERLDRLCREWLNAWSPPWHYHLIDVENLVVSYLAGYDQAAGEPIRLAPPWNSDALSAALGITVPEGERHTAMGDARWAMRIYDRVMGGAR